MKHVVILQKYLMPYRVPLFNAISEHPDIELTILYYGFKGEHRKATLYPQKKFREIQSRIFGFKKSYEHKYEIPLSLYQELEKVRPDIIICTSDFGGFAALLYAKIHKIKYIIWSEATLVTEAKWGYPRKLVRKLIYESAWRFLVPGSLAEKYIRSFVCKENIFFANNSIQEEDAFRVSDSIIIKKFKENKFQIIFSGSLIERKGLMVLLKSFKYFLDNNPEMHEKCYLRILGTGPLISQPYQNSNIIFEGFLEGKKYIDLMKSSHVFILPSLSDPNPLTVIEAMFSGNIIMVSDAVGSYPEAIKGNGVVMPAGSVDEVIKSFNYIFSLPRETLIEMALRSLSLSRNFTTQKSAEGFLAALFS